MLKLPHWVIPDKFPVFYDHESATVIEMVAKMHGVINELVDEYNKFIDETNTTLENYINKANGDNEIFRVELRQEFQDFIDVVELKIESFNSQLENKIDGVVQDIFDRDVSGRLEVIKSDLMSEFTTFRDIITTEVESIKSNMATVARQILNEALSSGDVSLGSVYDSTNESLTITIEGDI